MTKSSAPDWRALALDHDKELVNFVNSRFNDGGIFETTPSQLCSRTSGDTKAAEKLLENLVSTGHMDKIKEFQCPCEKERALSAEQAKKSVCDLCNEAFADMDGESPCEITNYRMDTPPGRLVNWVLALHGMNTRGEWQEELSWQVSKAYRYSVPFAIYKYGMVRPGVLLKWRRRQLKKEVETRIHHLIGEAEERRFGDKPDVIAHSFGTWLLGQALQNNKNLKVGRVILTGCILRPDFDWQTLFDRKQIEAVLCHYGTKDFWSGIAHYVIPDTGPSGLCGFNDSINDRIVHFRSEGFKHSDFFLEEKLPEQFMEIWKPFLTSPGENLKALNRDTKDKNEWKQANWFFRATVSRYLILIATLAVIGLLLYVFVKGVLAIWVPL